MEDREDLLPELRDRLTTETPLPSAFLDLREPEMADLLNQLSVIDTR